MRYSLVIVGLVLVAAVGDAAVVQRRYRNTEEVLVPVTVIQDGEEITEIKTENDVQPQVKSVVADVIAEDIAEVVDEEQKLVVVEAVVEAQRRLDDGLLEEEIKEVLLEENSELLKELQAKEEKLEEAKKKKTEETLVLLPAEEMRIQHETVLDTEQSVNDLKKLPVDIAVIQPETMRDSEQSVKGEQSVQQLKSAMQKDSSEELVVPVDTSDNEGEPEGTVRQATQSTPAQTTQQNFVQQFIQNSPLGQFFNQITGQNSPGQVANDDAGSAPATPNPTVPAFLAPALTTVQNAAQSVVNSTTSAFQGLTSFASTLGNQFQNTLSSLGGQQPVQQAASDATTARPQGPFQQLVSNFMGNNPQNAPASQPAPQQQGPLQGLLNIFQGNNRPQAATPPADTLAPQPGKGPEVVEQTEETVQNTADNLSNEIRNSAEVDDSYEDGAQPEELIVVQDDATQTQDQDQGYAPK